MGRLREVMARGGPAQRREAERLDAILRATPEDAEALAAAEQLMDAYFNDPYLEKDAGD